ncbi:MAG: trehalose/maltose transport system permease protein, partial [Thermoleophilaceae bacterium]|nr:trehalose/maltose transport system permease protein [Thermoleophilaceae bacterium]
MPSTPRQKVAWTIAILVVVLYALIPVAWIVSLSLKPKASIADGSFFPSKISFDNYDTLFQTSDFNSALVNSLGIAAISTLIAVVLAAMAAYALARLDFAGK